MGWGVDAIVHFICLVGEGSEGWVLGGCGTRGGGFGQAPIEGGGDVGYWVGEVGGGGLGGGFGGGGSAGSCRGGFRGGCHVG